ncbi:hypothetical protein HY636_02175 [Candidatus Woesearchaeota archaeon]|nr:hypothetical protein [Candidatus Woesearchaeota archaeon]
MKTSIKKKSVNYKLIIGLLLAAFILLYACSPNQYVCPDNSVVSDASKCNAGAQTTLSTAEEKVVNTQEQKDDIKETNTPEKTEIKQEVIPQLELTSQQTDTIKNMLMTQKTAIFPQMLGINDQVPVGGAYTYAFGIKNTNVKPAIFKYTIQLLESKTVSLSNGGADDTILSWFSKYTDTNKQYTLGKNEIAYIPLIVSVGEKANKEGKPTFAGTYKFRLKTETVEEPFTHDYHFFDFTLIVK